MILSLVSICLVPLAFSEAFFVVSSLSFYEIVNFGGQWQGGRVALILSLGHELLKN